MDLIYRIHNYKTYDAFRLKKILEYQRKPKEDLIKIIAKRSKESKNIYRAIHYLGSKKEIESLINYDRWMNIKIGFVKEALKNKVCDIH